MPEGPNQATIELQPPGSSTDIKDFIVCQPLPEPEIEQIGVAQNAASSHQSTDATTVDEDPFWLDEDFWIVIVVNHDIDDADMFFINLTQSQIAMVLLVVGAIWYIWRRRRKNLTTKHRSSKSKKKSGKRNDKPKKRRGIERPKSQHRSAMPAISLANRSSVTRVNRRKYMETPSTATSVVPTSIGNTHSMASSDSVASDTVTHQLEHFRRGQALTVATSKRLILTKL